LRQQCATLERTAKIFRTVDWKDRVMNLDDEGRVLTYQRGDFSAVRVVRRAGFTVGGACCAAGLRGVTTR
jgi:hypothetical protein